LRQSRRHSGAMQGIGMTGRLSPFALFLHCKDLT
jgi:hypothetical protein